MTLVIYTLFVLVEMILHLIRHFRYQKAEGETLMHAQKMDIRLTLLMDLLQLPLSLIFTRFLNLFSAVILVFGEAYPNQLAGSYAGDRRHLIGIGLGTVVAVIGVGRVIAIFNHGFKKKMDELAGMEA